MIWRFVDAERAAHTVAALCRALGVSRAGFYAWRTRPPSAHTRRDVELTRLIERAHADSRRIYGAPRVHAELAARGVRTSRKRVARIMRQRGLRGVSPRRYVTTTTPSRAPAPPDLVRRDFTAAAVNRLWVGDITYVRTWQGWLYLAVLVDVASRRVVGWACADHLRAELPLEALDMAVATRRPAPGLLVHHVDRGAQYLAHRYERRLRDAGITASASRVGTALDNALAESFLGTLKTECLNRQPWPTRRDATSAIADYIAFYNHERRHSAIGYNSPVDHETTLSAAPAA